MNFWESPEWFCIQVTFWIFVITTCFCGLFLFVRWLRDKYEKRN